MFKPLPTTNSNSSSSPSPPPQKHSRPSTSPKYVQRLWSEISLDTTSLPHITPSLPAKTETRLLRDACLSADARLSSLEQRLDSVLEALTALRKELASLRNEGAAVGETVADTAVLLSEISRNVSVLVGKQDVVCVEESLSVGSRQVGGPQERKEIETDDTEIVQLHFNEDTSRECGFGDFLGE